MTINVILEHLYIVLVSVLVTIVIGLPLGVFAYMHKRARSIVL